MTEEQKEILIARMLDCPDSLSAEDIRLIVQDEELRDIYELSADLKNAYTAPSEIDTAGEWRRFQVRLKRKQHRSFQWILHIAAIFLGTIFLTGVVVALLQDHYDVIEYPVVAAVGIIPRTENPKPVDHTEPTTLLSGHMSSSHSVAPAKPKDKPAYEAKKSVDIDEYLRIQQAQVDNNIATLLAETIVEQYCAMQEWNEISSDLPQTMMLVDGDLSIETVYINKVTMQ